MVDVTQQECDIVLDIWRQKVTYELAHFNDAALRSDFSTVYTSSCIIPQILQNSLVDFCAYYLTIWYKFPMNSAFVLKKYNEHHMIMDRLCFFLMRRPIAHPLQLLHLHFSIISINPCLATCCDVLNLVLKRCAMHVFCYLLLKWQCHNVHVYWVDCLKVSR